MAVFNIIYYTYFFSYCDYLCKMNGTATRFLLFSCYFQCSLYREQIRTQLVAFWGFSMILWFEFYRPHSSYQMRFEESTTKFEKTSIFIILWTHLSVNNTNKEECRASRNTKNAFEYSTCYNQCSNGLHRLFLEKCSFQTHQQQQQKQWWLTLNVSWNITMKS